MFEQRMLICPFATCRGGTCIPSCSFSISSVFRRRNAEPNARLAAGPRLALCVVESYRRKPPRRDRIS
jgi:hypothetical protein